MTDSPLSKPAASLLFWLVLVVVGIAVYFLVQFMQTPA